MIDRGFAERDAQEAGDAAADGFYEEFLPEPPFEPYVGRDWIKAGGGMLAADSPALSAQMIELFGARGVPGARRGLPRRAGRDLRREDHAAQGHAATCPAPGTRTARSWARCAR